MNGAWIRAASSPTTVRDCASSATTAVFRQANLRCERVLLTGHEREVPRLARVAEVRGKVPYATPHSGRHSMALYMLIVLNELMDKKYGLSAADRRDFAQLYGDPWWLVKTLLGHRDVEVTKEHYLAPVMHLQLESLLSFDTGQNMQREADESTNLDDLLPVWRRRRPGFRTLTS